MPYPMIPTVITLSSGALLEVFVIGGFKKTSGEVWLVYQAQQGEDPLVYFQPAPLDRAQKVVPPMDMSKGKN